MLLAGIHVRRLVFEQEQSHNDFGDLLLTKQLQTGYTTKDKIQSLSTEYLMLVDSIGLNLYPGYIIFVSVLLSICGDQALFVRLELFMRMGGFPDEPILEDLLFGEKLLKYVDSIILQDPVVTDSRKFETMGIWLSFYRVLSILVRHEIGLPVPRKFFTNIR